MAQISRYKRFEIFKRDDFTCRYCGAKNVRIEVDHVVPICKGGTDEFENLVTACFECNRGKAGTPLQKRIENEDCLFVVHLTIDGLVDWVGETVRRESGNLFVDTVRADLLMCGWWELSGRVEIAPEIEWRFFSTRLAATVFCHRKNEVLLANPRGDNNGH